MTREPDDTMLVELRSALLGATNETLPTRLKESVTVTHYDTRSQTVYAVLDLTDLDLEANDAIARVRAVLSQHRGVRVVSIATTAEKSAEKSAEPSTAPPPNTSFGTSPPPRAAPSPRHSPEGVHAVIAIGSGKGGVGKSTIASHLAVALARQGWRVGLLDADIYGPSQAHMLGVDETLEIRDQQVIPHQVHGIVFVSIANLVPKEKALVWRGPMVTKAIRQFLFDVRWNVHGPLDMLLVDLPPGTGDIVLSLVQSVPLNAALVVSTLQEVALLDVRKAITMFSQLTVPMIGLVANMSAYACPHCGELSFPFSPLAPGSAAPETIPPETVPPETVPPETIQGVDIIARIPLSPSLLQASEAGRPLTVRADTGHAAEADSVVADFDNLALKVTTFLSNLGEAQPQTP